ncbi:hypothetical protein C2S52_018858, partial [Perilla frutescens var. hirtella]
MAAYAALTSLVQILDQLEHHPFPPISLDKQQVVSLTEIATSLQKFLEGYDSPFVDSDEADPLEMRIADAAYAAEDVIESYIVDNIHFAAAATHDDEVSSPSEEMFSEDVWKVIEEMDLVKKEAMEKTAVQAHHQLQRNILRSSSFSGKNSSVMVGFEEVSNQLLDKLTREPSSGLQVIPITGMGGIGKTTLARHIFQHALVKEHFDICAWVTISQQYNTKEILSQILYQASGKSSEKSVQELGVELHKYLSGRRYIIIMDDIWSIKAWEEMGLYFPNCENGSQVVVTTRQSFLTSQLTVSNDIFHMKFLDEVNSWNLFSKTVFGEEGFPLRFKKIGKKIVEKCRGLPLSIVVIGGLLAKSQRTHGYWEQIEQKLNSIVNSENDEYCLKILKLSYNHLPAFLKPCFLYTGTFEEDTRIRVSTLINLLVCEGFIKPENGKTMETIGKEYLEELIDRNLILVDALGSTGNIKYCKIHDLLRDLCLKEAEKERFYYVIGKHSPQGTQNHNRRRMVFPHTFNERVLDAWRSKTSHARSFTFHSHFGACGLLPNFRLLRILNADELGFPEYRLQYVIHELVNSRYVAFRNTKLPASVNFLWNLHTLIIVCGVREHELIIAPVEIWKMSQLRHVEFRWGIMHLSDPPSCSSIVILENLETLKGVVNLKCGEEVVKRIPNIKRLLINYKQLGDVEIHPGGDYCLSNLECLHKLESLTIKVDQMDEALLHNITFPQSLKKLSLKSLNNSIGWEEMLAKIRGSSLPLLQKLKLENGRFTTHMWDTVEDQFPSLKFLSLHWCEGLEYWTTMDSSHFPCLEHLHLSRLEELEEIPSEIGEIPTLQSIQLRYCSESVVKSAKKIAEKQEEPFLVRVWERLENQEALKSLASPNFQFK